MKFPMWLVRMRTIALSGSSRLLSSLSNIIISSIIIRSQSASLWGQFIFYLLILDISFSFVSWGTTPYLIREFSLHPYLIKANWGKSISARSLLLGILLLVLACLPMELYFKFWLMAWSIFRFVYQSFDPIAQIERRFLFTLIVEAVGIVLIILPILLLTNVDVKILLILFTIGMAFKAIAFSIKYRKYILIPPLNLQFLKQAFPFLLLTFSAMMQQRIDLYCVSYFLDVKSTAMYQVFLSFLLFAQFAGSLLLSPYEKNIYRLSSSSFLKLERKFIIAGLWLSALSLLVIFMIIKKFYYFSLSWKMYAMGYPYILMFYIYLLQNYKMRKLFKQTQVAIFSFFTALFSLVCCLILVPKFGVEGALLSSLLAQVFLVLIFHRRSILQIEKAQF